MKRLSASSLRELATSALVGQGLSVGDATAIADEFVVAELSGVKTHGVGKLASLNLGELDAEPTFTQTGAVLAVDGAKSNGFLLMRQIVPRVGELAKANGVGVAFAHNFSRYSSLYPYTDGLARQGLVAILMNSAGPAAVAPFGSIDPLTGTNPICFSFPLADGSAQTFDFATSDRVWGAIRQAALEGVALPSGPFLASSGDVTTVPGDVNAVRAFGGAKGFALNLAVEVLAGLLTGAVAGNDVESEFDCGAVLIAFDPAASGARPSFLDDVGRLFQSVRECRAEDPEHPVRSPGDSGRSRVVFDDVSSEEVDVPATTIQLLERMAAGESIAELSSNPLFN